MIIVDSHEDLAWNILTFGRDYLLSAAETRRKEVGTEIPAYNGDALLGWPDYQRGQIAIVFATLFAAPMRRKSAEWDTLCYADFNQAHRLYQANLDLYHRLANEHPDKFRLILSQKDLKDVLLSWEEHEVEPTSGEGHPIGLCVLMEGAEGVRAPGELEEWWQRGVRLIGPAWAGTRYCGGTQEPGPMTPEGFALLEGMSSLGFALDLSHMDEPAALQALDYYPGQVLSSHANALALLKGSDSNRHLTDRVIHGLIERDGVIGVVPLNSFLLAGWKRGDPRQSITLQHVVAQIDYICQMAGDALHAGIGSDFDGGFGLQSTPPEIDTIADLQKLAPLLIERGYQPADIAAIFGENWITRIKRVLPES